MKKLNLVDHKLLCKKLNPHDLKFTTTDDIKPITEFFAQKRAIEALNFGIRIKRKGFNLYAMGPSGVGKRSLIKRVLKAYAGSCPIPPDWCYVNNFDQPEKPIPISLPAGYGAIFRNDMKKLVENLSANILSIFESDEYRVRMKKINESFKHRRAKIINKNQMATEMKTPKLYRLQHAKIINLQLRLTKAIIKPIIKKLKKKYLRLNLPLIVKYLRAVQKDITHHVQDLVKLDENTNLYSFSFDNPALLKYQVNLFVDNQKLKTAPYYFEENPNYANLIGRIEYLNQSGNIITNFTLMKAGSLPRMNKGFLIIEAHKIKKNPEAWEALKSALYTKKTKIESQDPINENIRPMSLDPIPIPLDIKIILVGERQTYYSLCKRDAEFCELFKVVVDFDEYIDRNKKNIKLYAGLIASIAQREKLRPFHANAVAAIIDYSSRLVNDNEKLSTYLIEITDLILESDFWASSKKRNKVLAADVKRAIDAQLYRLDRAKHLYYEDILRDFIIIKTKAALVGQVNCLAVRKVGNYFYGHPTRVTATIRLGRGKIIDIQREIKLAGPIHSKASLIITNFLSSHFNPNENFALSASLAFEQVYCWTDGDSASVGELCALLSALAEIPLNQSLAITGSIDQYGRVQAVGGVNEKIEGFYDICKAKGLTGKQGVVIPKVNKKNLMLRDDVVTAAKKGQFSIYTIDTIDDAIYLLTHLPAGKRNKNGQYDKNTFYHKIEMRLQQFAKKNPR